MLIGSGVRWTSSFEPEDGCAEPMSDPLVQFLKALREEHGQTQSQVAGCVGLAAGSYRHIERGRRPLPDFRHGLVEWVKRFLACVQGTPEEGQQGLELMTREFTAQ